jgi:hypothetical protein
MVNRENFIEKYIEKVFKESDEERDWFKRYEEVRQSGVTNMFDVNKVSQLSGLNRAEITFVMKNYSDLQKKYGQR